MAEVFAPNQNDDAVIVAEAPGHSGTEPWLGQYGALDCLRLCSLSPGQSNGCITGQVFDEIISFT